MAAIGERIALARLNAGLTQKQLAEKLGTSESYISQYERNKRNPKTDTIQRIAEALNVEIEELVDSETAKAIRGAIAEEKEMKIIEQLIVMIDRLDYDGLKAVLDAATKAWHIQEAKKYAAQE